MDIEKKKFDAENDTLDKCRTNIQEYMFYNLRNQIEMRDLMTYGKNEDEIKNLLKENNFDFVKVKEKLKGESGAAEGKIVIKVPKLY